MGRGPVVEGRKIRLHVFDGRATSERAQVDLIAVVERAIGLFEANGGFAEDLVASELFAIGAWPGFSEWYGALCGIRRCYVAPFDTMTYANPLFLAMELYGAAGVHYEARKAGVKSMHDIARLQHFAWKYQEQLIQLNELPDDYTSAFRSLRSVIP
jgi:hypothetical protein